MKTGNNISAAKNVVRYCCIVASLLLLSVNEVAVGQQYFIKSYAVENGLPTRIISDACQDKDGLMWFSTYLGISKYDGFSFTNYDTVNGLPNQHYRRILCDQKGIIWAIPFTLSGKIAYYENNIWKTIDLPVTKKINLFITSFNILYKNNSPVICVGSYEGVNVFQNKLWKHHDVSDDKSKNVVFNVIAKNDLFYLSTKAGLCILDGENQNWSLNEKINKTNEAIGDVTFENPGLPEEKLWILTNHSIGFFQNQKFTRIADFFLIDDIDLVNIPYLEVGKNGKIIFGNTFSKYLLRTSTSQIIPLKKKNGFSTNGASSTFIDREDNMWFMDSRGIDKISNIRLVNYYETSGLPENEVSAIIETNDGRYVLGHNNRISILKDNNFKVIDIPGPQNSLTRVLDIMKDRDGNIWFSANTLGVGRLTSDDKIQWFPSINGFKATSINQDNSGRVWIGSQSSLFYLKGTKVVEYEHSDLLARNSVRKIFRCNTGGIYVTNVSGLWHVDADTVIKIKIENETQLLNTFTYYKDKKGTEFVGTMNGLYYINNGIIKRFRNKKLNITDPIFFILQDNKNFYWFGTNNGVYRWDGINDPEVFNTFNGLAGRETNRSAGLLDSKGKIWVGTDKGLSCFDPGIEWLKTPAPSINLLYTETSRGVRFSLNKPCSVVNTDNTLSFHFRGISFVNEELLTYRYKLEGFDNDWREATQAMLDKIKYTNLKPGKYRLCVSARNYSSSWSPVVYSKEIVIKSPFYMTGWFQIIIVFTLFILLWIFYSFTSQRLINSALKKEIAERKLAEEKLKESEQRLSFIIEGSQLGTWDWDIAGNITHRNYLSSEMLGLTVEETTQSSNFWFDLMHPEDKKRVESELRLHLVGKTPLLEVEYRILTKSGKYKWILDRSMVVQRDAAGKPLRMSGTHTDITERKNAEDSLQISEERLRLLLASLPVAIYIAPVDPAIDLSMITGNVTALTGFTEEDFLSEPAFWIKRLHPDDSGRVLKAFNDAPANGGLAIEYRWKMADGTYKWIHDQSIIKTDGLQQEYLGVFVDINDLKVAEQEIKIKNEQLSLINAEKDKLFSIISHDLRSPVSGFHGLTEFLTEELDKISSVQLREIVTAMHTSAGKVTDLLNDLLEWSQLQRGITVFNPSVLSIKSIADECVSLMAEQAKAKDIEVINEIPAEMQATTDLHMLRLVLRNLLSNAVKFTPKAGRITISASFENKHFARISINDSGIGMNQNLVSKLFKVNEKTGRKGTEGESSSGLGLILCAEFIAKQNGKIWAESEEGKGSTFYFTVPCGK
jgi:PAS domain S-box-containing protein